MRLSKLPPRFVAALGVTFVSPATAALLFHEPFEYAADTTIGGQTPALGAASGWVDTSSGNGTPGGSPTAQPLTVRDNGTNGGASSGQTWSGITAGSGFPNTGGFLEGMRRDNNEGHIALAPSVTGQFTSGSTVWLSFVAAAATNTANDNNHEISFALGNGAFGGNETGANNRGQLHNGEAIGVSSPFNQSDSRVQAAYWDGAGAVNMSAAFTARITPQQLFVIKIEFDAVDVVTVGTFDISGAFSLTEAGFNAATTTTVSSALDESTFNTLAFDGVRANFDEIRLATTFDEAVGASGIPEPSSALLGLLGFGALFARRRR